MKFWRMAGMALVIGVLVGCSGGGGDAAPATAPDSGGTTAPPAGASQETAPTGTAAVSGTVRFEGTVPPLRPLKMNADPGCEKKHSGPVMPEFLVLGEGNSLANVLVRVKGGLPGGSYPAPTEPAILDQNGCRYSPHVQGVRVGQEFKVLNSDGLLHNVHSLPKVNAPFNRAMPGAVTEAIYTFTKEEDAFKIKCDVHPWMNAWVSVLSHPYFSVTGTGGEYKIEGLPAGDYEIEAWHEKLGTRVAQVTVTDGGTGTADFSFKK